jgi:hypothetical protein
MLKIIFKNKKNIILIYFLKQLLLKTITITTLQNTISKGSCNEAWSQRSKKSGRKRRLVEVFIIFLSIIGHSKSSLGRAMKMVLFLSNVFNTPCETRHFS